MGKDSDKMGLNGAWSMAVGGMVGGGIFSVLGVVVTIAGQWAWLSFVIAGLIALVSAHSYSQLSKKMEQGGGSFLYLRQMGHKGWAGSLAWILILGYMLTISVYAFTFGHYVAHVMKWGSWFPGVLAFAVIAVLTLVNLGSVSESSTFEIITVWGKLFFLLALAAFGLFRWDTPQMTAGIEPKPWLTSVTGAASIFMAYEGFQLLAYDYDEMDQPGKTLPQATITAVIAVILVYVLTDLGATMLTGAKTIIEQKEIALAIAGKQALGTTGLVLMTIAAAFSTGSAINATLFSTGRLMEDVARDQELPVLLAKKNKADVPHFSILLIAALAAVLSVIGSLEALVNAAGLIFLFTFGTVNWLAYRKKTKLRMISLLGAVSCAVAIIVSSVEQIKKSPLPFALMIGLILTALISHHLLHKKMDRQDKKF